MKNDAQSDLEYKLLTIRLRVDCLVQSYNRLAKTAGQPGMTVRIGGRKRKGKSEPQTTGSPVGNTYSDPNWQKP